MGDFYIEVGSVKPFVEGKCSYITTKAKPFKDENEHKSIILIATVTDMDGEKEEASVFLSKSNPEVVDAFCKINKIELSTVDDKKILRLADCISKSNGICIVKRAKNLKYLNIISFLDEQMPTSSQTKESFDDDIPF